MKRDIVSLEPAEDQPVAAGRRSPRTQPLHRRVRAARRHRAAHAGPGPVRRRHRAAAHGARRLLAQPDGARAHPEASNADQARAHAGRAAAWPTATTWPRCASPGWPCSGHLTGMKSAPQYAAGGGPRLLAGRAGGGRRRRDARARPRTRCATSRSTGTSCRAVTDMETALDPATPLIHPELGDNLCFTRSLDTGGVDEAFARADVVVEATFDFGRHTGVTLEPRVRSSPTRTRPSSTLTVYHSHPGPAHDAGPVRAPVRPAGSRTSASICKDVGGSFGIKVHVYPDEFATVGAVDHAGPAGEVRGRPARESSSATSTRATTASRRASRCDEDGEILGFDIDDLTGIGPYSVYPRTSAHRGQPGGQPGRRAVQAQGTTAPSWTWCSRTRRRPASTAAVGHPIAWRVTEGAGGPGGAASSAWTRWSSAGAT